MVLSGLIILHHVSLLSGLYEGKLMITTLGEIFRKCSRFIETEAHGSQAHLLDIVLFKGTLLDDFAVFSLL
ncbi:hypothetical protein GGR52DRAFT_523237 [Hypoxylon sp. FL1284]|nr:hypothetical protein GGR52DRAFT_523237 [Hypoxylon sp. FL1284]